MVLITNFWSPVIIKALPPNNIICSHIVYNNYSSIEAIIEYCLRLLLYAVR